MGVASEGQVRIWERYGLAVILLAFAAIYARSVTFDFVWDDVEAIVDNPIYAGPLLDGLDATQHDHLDPALRKLSGMKPAHDSYRPLLYLSYRSDVTLSGMSPRGMHLHNLILALLSIVAFYFVASRWLMSDRPALMATAIFALHPLQVESVAYVSGRGDLLAGLFALLAVAAALQFEQAGARARRALWLLTGTACLLASLLSKEAYLGLPVALAGVAFARGRLRAQGPVLAAWFVALAAYLALRFAVGGVAESGTGARALVALPGIFLRYLEIALLPFDLSTERLYDGSYVLPGWLALGALAVWASVGLLRGWSQTSRAVASGLLWMLVLLGPSAVVVILMGVVADRYSYLPLGGFAVACAALLSAAMRQPHRLRAVIGLAGFLWAAMCVTVTVVQIGTWKDNRTLYGHAVATAPESSMAHYRLGHSYAKEGKWPEAIALFERAVELQPSNLRALNNLGVGYLNTGNYPQAARTFERALAESGQMHFRAWYNLGVAQMNMGEREAACSSVERALHINPSYSAAVAFRRASCQRSD
ncbi:MAG: tetratricopeptide repeat protein [Deltaproteobacteria bacterium]|nr:tetratricopeptide repeat protein [Deltaproteobacteria bacterium]NND29816.1 tetratricopeptide repeat protein [Myxococcales bacterium]MBT8465424.1 tetratricopeptide repeat protein [Deltaproteobacteria bacterium]MBT8483059.1 tetratricopeptide repeat protein [Deltaproteobacteria bacterium]NNK09508.1 tetratricopeptide repeat protein [Myxococcales bacterium]